MKLIIIGMLVWLYRRLRHGRLLIPFLLYAAPAFAGTCPSTANMDNGAYAAPTNCFYHDFVGGLDTNTGADEAHALKHVRGMTGCASNCVTEANGAGVGYILKGGVTWDWTIWPWNLSGGGTSSTITYGCAGAGCQYYGVDKSWFTGGSWTRPIMSGGDWSNPGTNTTCFYDVAGVSGGFIKMSSKTFLIIDNLEFAGACNTTGSGGANPVNYLQCVGCGNNTVENAYFHRAAFSAATAAGGFGDYMRTGGCGSNSMADSNVMDFADSGPTTTSAGVSVNYTGGGLICTYYKNNVFANMTQATSEGGSWTIAHDNIFLNANASPAYNLVHPHIFNDSGCPSVGAAQLFWNNFVDTTFTNTWQPNGNGGGAVACTVYNFNNVFTDNGAGGKLLNWAPAPYTMISWNDTMECVSDGSGTGGPCGSLNQAAFQFYNMHFIYDVANGALTCSTNGGTVATCASFQDSSTTVTTPLATYPPFPGTPLDLISQTKAVANAQGYLYSQTFRFSPTLISNATVGVGVNETTLCNSLIFTEAIAACKQDTSYGVTYNQTNHTAVCCARTPINRPAVAAWDVGAYQFPTSITPPAPANLLMGITYPAPGKILVTLSNAVICAKTCKILLTCQTDCGPTYSGSVQ